MLGPCLTTQANADPADLNRLAASIVGYATGPEHVNPYKGKNPDAVELGRLGGNKGGAVHSYKLKVEYPRKIAKKATVARWRRQDE